MCNHKNHCHHCEKRDNKIGGSVVSVILISIFVLWFSGDEAWPYVLTPWIIFGIIGIIVKLIKNNDRQKRDKK